MTKHSGRKLSRKVSKPHKNTKRRKANARMRRSNRPKRRVHSKLRNILFTKARLEPEDLDALCGIIRAYAIRTGLADAEDEAMEAFVRALASFDQTRGDRTTPAVWAFIKVKFAIRNLRGDFPSSKVRDAFRDFEQKYGFKPGVKRLARFMKISPRCIVNVLDRVSWELELKPADNSLLRSMQDWGRSWSLPLPDAQSPKVYQIREALANLKPTEACLIVLKHLCEYSEQEILSIIITARQKHKQNEGNDCVDEYLDKVTFQDTGGVSAPWDVDLFEISTRGCLASRLYRARELFFLRLKEAATTSPIL